MLLRPPVQLAYTVADVDEAVPIWVQRFGAGPFFVLENIALRDVVVRGEASSLDHTSAYGWAGDVMIELVQQNCATPSIFNNRPYGLHHTACFADDLDAELARLDALGAPTAMRAVTVTGTAYAFADTTESLGHYVEIYGEQESIRDFYELVRSASADWLGDNPLRRIG